MIRKFLLLFGTQIVFGFTLILNNLMIARLLGPVGKGQMALLVVIPAMTVVIANLGFHLSAAHFVSRKEYPLHEVFGVVFGLTGGLTLVLAAGSTLFWETIQRVVYRGLPASVVLVSLLSLPALILISYFEGLWIALDRMAASVSIRLCQGSVYFLLGLLLVARLRYGVLGGILAFTISAYSATALTLVWCRWISPRWPAFSAGLLRRGLRFGLAAHPGNVADHALYRADMAVVGYMAGFRQLGYYSFAVALAELIWWVTSAIRPVLFARTSRALAPEANVITPLVLRGSLALASLLALGVFAAGWAVVRLFLPEFSPALPVLAILLGAKVTALVFQLTLADLTSRGWGARASQVGLLVLPFGIVCYLVFIPWLGIVGAAVGSFLSYLLESLIALFLFWKLTGVRPRQLLLPGQVDYQLTAQLGRQFWRRIL